MSFLLRTLCLAVLFFVRKGHSTICVNGQGWCLLDDATLINETFVHTSMDIPTQVKAKEAGGESPWIRIESASSTGLKEIIHPGYYVYKEPYHWQNIGHTLGDDIVAIYIALYTWDLHRISPKNLYIIIPDRSNELYQIAKRKKIISELYQIITRNELIFASFDKRERYEHFFVGWNRLTYSYNQNALSVPMLHSLRIRALGHFGLNEPVERASCRVLFVAKDVGVAEHKFSIGNLDELQRAVALNTNCSASTISWQGLGLRDQLKAIYLSTIVVSLPGSDIMNNIFQPMHSGMLVPDRCDSSKGTCEGSNEIRLWYSNIPYRHIKTFGGMSNPNLQWKDTTLYWKPSHLVHEVNIMWDAIFRNIVMDGLDVHARNRIRPERKIKRLYGLDIG